jgi:hypothetical protein
MATSGKTIMEWIDSCPWLIYIFPLTVVACVKGIYSRFADRLYFSSKRLQVMGLLVWGWVPKHSMTSVFELKNICNTLHSHTPRIIDVPLTGIHSIRHPEKYLFVIPIYEINDGFRILYISQGFLKLSSMEETLKYFFFLFRSNRTYKNVYKPEKNEGVCRAYM